MTRRNEEGAPALANNTSIRRKTQKLIRKGAFAEAVTEFARLEEAGELESYDLVVFADVLNRAGDREGSVQRYIQAMDSYAQAGLHRNAIALGKKVQRLSSDYTLTHRKLGDLYAAEGLSSESCLHYLEYLEQIDVDDSKNGEAVEEVCVRLLELSLPTFDVVDRIVEVAKLLGREKPLAEGLLHQSRQAAAMGNTEAESKLKQLAKSVDPDAMSRASASPGNPAGSVGPTTEPVEPGDLNLGPGEPAMIPLDDVEPEGEADGTESPEEPPLEVEGLGDLGKKEFAEEPATSSASRNIAKADAIRAQGMSSLGSNEPVRAQMEFMKAAALYFDAGASPQAAELFEKVVSLDPNHLAALSGLVEIAHINGEKAKMAHWGCELGDVLLAREKYADAKVQFERVLAFDPDNAKAQARVKRLNAIAGVAEAGFGPLTPAASEVKGAQVTIRDDEEDPASQSALNLSQILEEFRAAMVDTIPSGDARSHFDLGVTYHEMGLHEEAVQEFETAAASEENRLASLEMLGECYLHLERLEDAIRVYEEFVNGAEDGLKATAYLNLGRAREALGQWDQAEEEYIRALNLDENLTDAAERLQDLERRRDQGAA